MKNQPFYFIITMLVLWIVFRECGNTKPPTPIIQANTDSIIVKNDRVASLDKAGQAIARKMALDSIRNLEALKRSESRVEGLTKSLAAALNHRPSMRVDTIYPLADSVIQSQASQITLLTNDRDTLRINYARLLRIKDAEIRIKDEMFAHMEAINSELFRTLNKERRRSKLWKIAIPVALVGGFILGEEL